MTFESAPNEPHTLAEKKLNPWLKLTLEMGPLVLFFLANAYGEKASVMFPALAALGGPPGSDGRWIYLATATFIVATVLALAVSFAFTRRLPLMPFVTAIVVVIFGGLTIYLQNATFIKMKPTIIYLLFAGVLLGGLAFGKSFIGYVFDAVFHLSDEGWRKLTVRWGLLFLAFAVLNEILWRSVSTDVWVAFKVFGFLPLTFLFALAQVPLINRYALPEPQA
jgi:intracellular septation protein